MSRRPLQPGKAPRLLGGDMNPNLRELVDKMVTVEGRYLIIRVPHTAATVDPPRTLRVSTGEDREKTRDDLRAVIHQLLKAVAFDVQERFDIRRRDSFRSGTGARPPLDADAVIGPDLAQNIKTPKTQRKQQA